MKSEIIKIEQIEQEDTYPCIKKHKYSDLVVLFNEAECGTVLIPTSTWQIGFISGGWTEEDFEKVDNITINFTS